MRNSLISFLMFCFLSVTAQDSDSLSHVLGKINYATNEAFVIVPELVASRSGMYLRNEVLSAFSHMKQAAKKDGVNLTIISAARNFNHQKRIWEAKWNGIRLVGGKNLKQSIPDEKTRALEILKYSSMPGTSRHHWGTDIDINSLNPLYFESGRGRKEYEWLRDYAIEFGFCQVYSEKGVDRKSGYEEEKWHWSYVPIARTLTNFYVRQIKNEHLQGFEGSSTLTLEEKLKYVLGIAPQCN
jgi:LAS superfamily LD-carboxypeptidase LdcB